MPIRAMLFDMDGLLVDSEALHLRAFAHVGARLGFACTPGSLHSWVGKGQHRLAAWMVQQAGKGDAGQVVADQRAEFLRLVAEERPGPLPGASELLAIGEELEMPVGLVSNSDRELVEATMRAVLPHMSRPLKLSETFAVVVSRSDVENPKPAPDVYLKAARDLGLEPAETLAFEDSPTGVAAAKAAGCRVVAIPSAYLVDPTECTADADEVCGSLVEVAAKRLWER